MSKPSPTKLSLDHARKRLGWTAAVVEKWNAFAKIRQDLWGFDILAIRPDRPGVTGIQASTGAHHARRAKKLAATPALRRFLAAGNAAEVWTWTLRSGRWELRRSELRAEDLAPVDLTPKPPRCRKHRGLFDAIATPDGGKAHA
ncbi:MAG TPA: hypothetical protein VMS17_17745 [Gemmataceae bacterium]|nr:hypothetical protein [Gemmataceae bacterium]